MLSCCLTVRATAAEVSLGSYFLRRRKVGQVNSDFGLAILGEVKRLCFYAFPSGAQLAYPSRVYTDNAQDQ